MTNCTDNIANRVTHSGAAAWKPALAAVLALTLTACASSGPSRPSAKRTSSAASTPAAAAPSASANEAKEAAKGDPDQRFQQALALMKARKYPEAQAAFIALSKDYPNFSGPFTDLGILYAQGRQHELAVASLTRAVAANPNNEVAHNWLGTLHRENHDFVRAEQSYRKAISVKPEYAQAHLNLAILYDVALHRPKDAVASYKDYQRIIGTEDLIVAAWIREIESRMTPLPAPTKVADATP